MYYMEKQTKDYITLQCRCKECMPCNEDHNCFSDICDKCNKEMRRNLKMIQDLKNNNQDLAKQNNDLKELVTKLKNKCMQLIDELLYEIRMEHGTPRNKCTNKGFTLNEFIEYKMNQEYTDERKNSIILNINENDLSDDSDVA